MKREELPKSYEDLLHPRWRRRMVLDRNEDRWFANMLHHMGEKKGMEFMQALAKQEVAIRSGRSLITQLMAAGEFDLQIVAYWYRPYLMKKQGAPVDWFSLDPAFVALHPISIIERAPHLNAAKLFVEYVLSEEGQRLLAQKGTGAGASRYQAGRISQSFEGCSEPSGAGGKARRLYAALRIALR